MELPPLSPHPFPGWQHKLPSLRFRTDFAFGDSKLRRIQCVPRSLRASKKAATTMASTNSKVTPMKIHHQSTVRA